jgi:hypothetical protein
MRDRILRGIGLSWERCLIPEAYIMYFVWRYWFLNCSAGKGCMVGVGGGGRYVMFLYIPIGVYTVKKC